MNMIVTRLWPASFLFVGKTIHGDGRIDSAPNIKSWKHKRLEFASLEELQDDLTQTMRDNCCLIRDTTTVPEGQTVLRKMSSDNLVAFDDTPTTFFAIDADSVHCPQWLEDAPTAIDAAIITPLKRIIGDAGYLVTLSSTAGLERDPTTKAWTGRVGGDKIRCRIYFHLSEALDRNGAKALTRIMQGIIPEIDTSLADRVHIHYCTRPRFVGTSVGFDPVVACGVPLIWLRTGRLLAVPTDLDLQGEWAKVEAKAKTEGNQPTVYHPDVDTAIAAIGSDGIVYPHIRAAVRLWLKSTGLSDNLSPEEIGLEVLQDLRARALRHKQTILTQLKGRAWREIEVRLERGAHYAAWIARHDDGYCGRGVLRQKIDWKAVTAPPRLTLREGRAALQAINDAFIAGVTRKDPTIFDPDGITQALCGTTGLGKSRTLHDAVAKLLEIAVKKGRPVIYASSRHILGAEQLQRMVDRLSLSCAQWRGRQAEDPLRPGRPMCERHEEARAVASAGDEPKHLCRRKKARCPFYEICGYRRQMKYSGDVWFVAHDALLHARPDNIHKPLAVIIDESPMSAMLFGIDEVEELALDALRMRPQKLVPAEADELEKFRRELWNVFDRISIGPLPTNRIRTTFSFYPQIPPHIRRMIALEWRTLEKLNIHPGMSREAVFERVESCSENRTTLRRIQLYELIAEAVEDGIKISGRITVVNRSATGRAIQMCGIRPVLSSWKAPILTLDATLDMRLLQRLWPQAVLAANIQIDLPPHVKVTQTVNAPFAKNWLTSKGREARRACEVYGAVLGEIVLTGAVGPTLIITHKAVEEVLRAKAVIPPWVEIAHHGNITGMDQWKDCRHLVVIGRPLPRAEDAVRATEALFGEYIPVRTYQPAKVNIRIVADAQGNTAVEVRQMQHEDANVEAIRRQVTEAGIIQAAGRGRGITRTEANPLDIWLLTDVKIEELEPVHARLWDEFTCNADAQMLARGVWVESHADAAMIYPDLFASADALTKQRTRASNRTFIYKSLSIDKRPIARSKYVCFIGYCKSEVGAHPTSALFL
jgi:hypothetical protein